MGMQSCDWNSHANWSNIIGRFSLGQSNQRVNRLLELCTKHNIMLANTTHPQKNSRKST